MENYRGFQIILSSPDRGGSFEYDYSKDGKFCDGTESSVEECKQAIDKYYYDQLHVNTNFDNEFSLAE